MLLHRREDAEHDVHSEEGKKVEAKLWDYFVSSVKAGNTTTPVIFSVRSIDRDTRAQIYAVNTEIEAATSHGDASRENPQSRLPNYGGFTTSNADKISREEGNVNREYSLKTGEQGQLEAKDAPKTPNKDRASTDAEPS